MEILIIITTIISMIAGLLCGWLLWYTPCNHKWTLLETHTTPIEQLEGEPEEMIKSVYSCSECGKLKTINFFNN
jgi:hypothetical protein